MSNANADLTRDTVFVDDCVAVNLNACTYPDQKRSLTAWQRVGAHTHAMDVRIRDPLELSLPPMTQDWAMNFSSDVLKQAHAYWTAVRGERRRPTRAELTPAGMAKFLRHVALLEVRHVSATKR